MIKTGSFFRLARQGLNGANVAKSNIAKSVAMASVPKYYMNHIKNMLDENLKVQVEQAAQSTDLVQKYDRIYKPTYTIEFNREGEVLLYSCDPLQHTAVYFKYPYVLYETMIPASLWMWIYNPLDLEWYWNNGFLFLMNFLWIPRMWYWRSLHYKIRRLYLLRGGKVAKFETQTLAGDRYTSWVENYQFHPLTADQRNFDHRDDADFLGEEGQLKYELAVQLDHVQEMGVTSQDIVYWFMKEGVIHHPELFEAVCKGYNVDTSDFVINTAHNMRAREGNHNQ